MKIKTGKEKKEEADQAFKAGDVRTALLAYHQALMYFLGLDRNAMQSLGMAPMPPAPKKDEKSAKERTEVDEIIERIYANMSACHLKNQNWKRAEECAAKALAKNENNYKALFRKGKALGEQGYYEKAVKILQEVKEKNPSDAAAAEAELARLKVIDDEKARIHKQQLKGFLNKANKKGKLVEETQSADGAVAASAT